MALSFDLFLRFFERNFARFSVIHRNPGVIHIFRKV